MFAPNLRGNIFGWLERLKNSAGIRLSHKKIRRRQLVAATEGSNLIHFGNFNNFQ